MEVLVKVYDNEALAQLWAGILNNEGIKTMVKPAMSNFPLPYHGPFIPHGLYVLEPDAQRAREVLEDQGEASVESPGESP